MSKVDIAVVNGGIIDGGGEETFRGSVLIDGDRIAGVIDDGFKGL